MDKKEFFADRLINDDKNYFYAAYDSTSNSYTFTGLQNYIMNIFQYDPNNILNPDHSLNPAADYAYDSDIENDKLLFVRYQYYSLFGRIDICRYRQRKYKNTGRI